MNRLQSEAANDGLMPKNARTRPKRKEEKTFISFTIRKKAQPAIENRDGKESRVLKLSVVNKERAGNKKTLKFVTLCKAVFWYFTFWSSLFVPDGLIVDISL